MQNWELVGRYGVRGDEVGSIYDVELMITKQDKHLIILARLKCSQISKEL